MNKDVLAYVRSVLVAEFGRQREGNRWVDTSATLSFMKLYYKLLNSETNDEYQSNLRAIENMSKNAANYLRRYWLNNHAEKLINCYTNQITHFNLIATLKAEGAHRVIKAWLQGSGADILTLFRRLDILYKEHVEHNRMRDLQDN